MIFRWYWVVILALMLTGCLDTNMNVERVPDAPPLLVEETQMADKNPEQSNVTLAAPATGEGQSQTETNEIDQELTRESRQAPEDWENWPVIPRISSRAVEIYQIGLSKGTSPRSFSKVGDCETITEWFLADFDKGSKFYDLGGYQHLQEVLDYYEGSYERLGVAAQRGFTAASVMNPYWRNTEICEKTETPLACEFRLHNPSLAIIMVGTNDAVKPASFEKNLRAVIEASIQEGVVPLLTTKADNLEGDHRINFTVAKLAYEYDLPMWNFWRSLQDLPNHGLQEDGAHLTWGPNDFSEPTNLLKAWPVRNLTALQVLYEFQSIINNESEDNGYDQ